MAWRQCPACGAKVKLENLERHVTRVHPREHVSLDLTGQDRNSLRQLRQPRLRIPLKRSTVVVVAVVLLAAVGLGLAFPYLPSPGGPAQMVLHWHAELRISIDGGDVPIPANVGIDPRLWQDRSLDRYGMTGMAPLHTHDASGTIHIESTVVRDYTLEDFFRIWGETFDATQVLGHPARPGHRVWIVVDGVERSPSQNPVLLDGVRIHLVCGVS